MVRQAAAKEGKAMNEAYEAEAARIGVRSFTRTRRVKPGRVHRGNDSGRGCGVVG